MNTGATPQGCSGHKRSVTNDGTVYCANFSATDAAAHRGTPRHTAAHRERMLEGVGIRKRGEFRVQGNTLTSNARRLQPSPSHRRRPECLRRDSPPLDHRPRRRLVSLLRSGRGHGPSRRARALVPRGGHRSNLRAAWNLVGICFFRRRGYSSVASGSPRACHDHCHLPVARPCHSSGVDLASDSSNDLRPLELGNLFGFRSRVRPWPLSGLASTLSHYPPAEPPGPTPWPIQEHRRAGQRLLKSRLRPEQLRG